MKPNENQSPIGSGAESGQSNTKNLSSLPVGSDAPVNEKYHDQTALCKGLLVASAGEKDVSTEQRVPNFFPAVAPVGGIILYAGVLGAGVYSSSILWQLMQESQSGLVAVGVPALIGAQRE